MTNLEILNLGQRITGVVALGLITLQIYLGASQKKITFHKINGIFAYSFILIHPILFLLSRKITYNRLDFYYVFVDVCVLCGKVYDHLINFGRIAFIFVTIAVLAVKLRDYLPWFKTNWRKLHILNYFAFYFISVHSISLGSDSRSSWFVIYFILCQLIVLYSIVRRLKTSGFVAKLKNKWGL
jgi:predicted ferric reductase